MAKATIKSRSGALITIEGSHDEVSRIIAVFENIASVERHKKAEAKGKENVKERKKRAAASDLVIDLKEEGFLDQPKGLGEIGKALEAKGFIYPTTTLSGVMLGLVQKKLLGRKKIQGRWAYGK